MQDNRRDDLDIEIVNIDDEALHKKRGPHSSFDTRFSPRQRQIQAVVTISVVTLVLLIILGSNSAIRGRLLRVVVPSTPTPTEAIPLGTDHFYFNGDPGWGHLFLDGKLVKHLPDANTNDPPIHLSRGTHTLQWDAFPFPRQTCTVSVPPKFQTDTCGYNSLISNNEGGGWQFSFHANLAALPVEQHDSLIVAVQAALQQYTSTESVQAGELYATDALSGHYAIAHEPLKATLHYELDTDLSSHAVCGPFAFVAGTESCMHLNQDCRSFCTAPEDFNVSYLVSRTWNVFAVARAVWDYTTLEGKPVLLHQVDMFAPTTTYEHSIPLQISWDMTQWHVTSSFSLLAHDRIAEFPPPICDSAQNNEGANASLRGVLQPTYFSTNWNYVAAPNAAAGCLGVVTLYQGQTLQPAHAPALCLYRFSVFLAANDVAHTYWPTMPLADTYEQHLAQQLHEASMSTQTG